MNSLFLFLMPICAFSKPERPNIMLILMDDLPYSDLGYLGGDIPTPAIDQLANTGIRLNYHYAENVCSATRSALLSGRYAWKTNLNDVLGFPVDDGINTDFDLISDVLHDNDYETLFVGKWHAGAASRAQLPHQRGFDESIYFTEGQINYNSHDYCFAWGMAMSDGIYEGEIDDPETLGGLLNAKMPNGFCAYDLWVDDHQSVLDIYTNQYAEDIYYEKITDYLNHYVNDVSGSDDDDDAKDPFFIYWALQTPHTPLTIPPITTPVCDAKIGEDRQVQCNMVYYADLLIGQVIQDLVNKDLYEDTVIVFLSDNGAQVPLNNLPLFTSTAGQPLPFRGAKYNTFEGGIRTPAVFGGGYFKPHEFPNFPESIGCDYNNMVYVADIYAMISHLANIDLLDSSSSSDDPVVPPIDGINVWPDIQRECGLARTVINNNAPITTPARRNEIIVFKLKETDPSYIHRAYVRTNEYKLLINPNVFGIDNLPLLQFDQLENWVNYDGTEYSEPNEEYYNLYSAFDAGHFDQKLFHSQCFEDHLKDPANNPINTEPYLDSAGNKLYLFKIKEDNIEACNIASTELDTVNRLMARLQAQIPFYEGSYPHGEKGAYVGIRDTYNCDDKQFFYDTWADEPQYQNIETRWDDIFMSIIDTVDKCP